MGGSFFSGHTVLQEVQRGMVFIVPSGRALALDWNELFALK